MDKQTLDSILDSHGRWLQGEQSGQRANLQGADLQGADLDLAICRMDFGGWSICVYADRTTIGCQTRSNEAWLSWSHESLEIEAMHPKASAWWAIHGEAVKAVICCVQAKGETKQCSE